MLNVNKNLSQSNTDTNHKTLSQPKLHTDSNSLSQPNSDEISKLSQNNSNSVFVSKKLVFPKEENNEFNQVKDNRNHFMILSDIVNILSEKLDPEMKALWDEFLQRDSAIPCFYRSGLAMLTSDVKHLSKK